MKLAGWGLQGYIVSRSANHSREVEEDRFMNGHEQNETSISKLARFARTQFSIPLRYRLGQTQMYPIARSEEDFLQGASVYPSDKNTRTLDIGCGENLRNPFHATESFGVDSRSDLREGTISVDLNSQPLPFPDDNFDFITAFDFIEHVPRILWSGKTRYPFVELMSEINRTLKVGGIFFSRTPAYHSKQAFQDPTHVNIITEDTFPMYFCGANAWAGAYGFKGNFSLVKQEWNRCWLLTILKKMP